MLNVKTVLNAERGLVEAPAGCGKTQLIVEVLSESTDRPTLVLTHTSAGVAALRNRLLARGISKSNYKIATIDSWVMNAISCYPKCAGYAVDFENVNYIAIREAATKLCNSGAINGILNASYKRLLVDEYQDCSVSQHAFITALSNVLPTVVFGDPLQAIFGFRGDVLPHWRNEVLAFFPYLGTLDIPWRWNNVGSGEFGTWLLQIRQYLLAGQAIDLRTCPNFVEWIPIPNNSADLIQVQVNTQFAINKQFPNDKVLIIGDSINADTRHSYASRARGVHVVETVELRDTLGHIKNMNGQTGRQLLEAAVNFLKVVMVNVDGSKLLTRTLSILNGTNRTPATDQESAAVCICQNGGYAEVLVFLETMKQDPNRRIYRELPFHMVVNALKRVTTDRELNLIDVFISIREQHRHAGRTVTGRAIGSTLLLKGLEADHTIILDADNPGHQRRMNAKHLYVALTRGAKSVKVFSRSPILPFN